jgi:hypothetical protein
MARYKEYSYDQGKLIPITFREQIIPGSFEFALNDIVDNVLDLSLFEKRFGNDETGGSGIRSARYAQDCALRLFSWHHA